MGRRITRRTVTVLDQAGIVVNRLRFLTAGAADVPLAFQFQLQWEYTNVHNPGSPLAGPVPDFTSSNPTVMTVDAAGLVTTHAPGNATITALGQGLAAEDPPAFTVVDTGPGPVVVDLVEVSPATLTLSAGQPAVLQVVAKAAGVPVSGTTITPLSLDAGKATAGAMNTAADPFQTCTVTAGPGTGSVTIRFTEATYGVQGTCVLDVTPASAATPVAVEDFDYVDDAAFKSTASPPAYLAGVRDGWEIAAQLNIQNISLDTGFAGPLSLTGKSMRYLYRDRIDEGPPGASTTSNPKGYCADKTTTRVLRWKTQMVEQWAEVWTYHEPHFVTDPGPGLCAGSASSALKFWFYGKVQNPNISRWGSTIHDHKLSMQFPTFQMPSGNWDGNQFYAIASKGTIAVRGRWIRHRVHARCSTTYNLPAQNTRIWEGTFRGGSTSSTLQIEAGQGAGVTASTYLTIMRLNGSHTCVKLKAVSGAGGPTPSVTFSTISLPSSMVPAINDTYIIATQPPQGNGYHRYECDGAFSSTATDLVTASLDSNERIFQQTGLQRFYANQFCANMNTGPVGQDQMLWWSDYKRWATDPGWGW